MTIKKNKTLGSASLLLILLNANVYAVTDNISAEIFKNEDGNRYWEIEVKCTDKEDVRYIRKQSGSDNWCLSTSPEVCFDDTVSAAQNVCSEGSGETPKAVETSSGIEPEIEDEGYIDDDSGREVDVNALNEEKTKLKAELLQIQQKKVELKRQEIELKKEKEVL